MQFSLFLKGSTVQCRSRAHYKALDGLELLILFPDSLNQIPWMHTPFLFYETTPHHTPCFQGFFGLLGLLPQTTWDLLLKSSPLLFTLMSKLGLLFRYSAAVSQAAGRKLNSLHHFFFLIIFLFFYFWYHFLSVLVAQSLSWVLFTPF